MLQRVLVGFGMVAILLALATSAMAAGPIVDAVLAIEYDHGVFANGVVIVPDRASEVVLGSARNLTLFKFTKFGAEAVVAPGDEVTAFVTDLTGITTEASINCAAGRLLRQLVVCR